MKYNLFFNKHPVLIWENRSIPIFLFLSCWFKLGKIKDWSFNTNFFSAIRYFLLLFATSLSATNNLSFNLDGVTSQYRFWTLCQLLAEMENIFINDAMGGNIPASLAACLAVPRTMGRTNVVPACVAAQLIIASSRRTIFANPERFCLTCLIDPNDFAAPLSR